MTIIDCYIARRWIHELIVTVTIFEPRRRRYRRFFFPFRRKRPILLADNDNRRRQVCVLARTRCVWAGDEPGIFIWQSDRLDSIHRRLRSTCTTPHSTRFAFVQSVAPRPTTTKQDTDVHGRNNKTLVVGSGPARSFSMDCIECKNKSDYYWL